MKIILVHLCKMLSPIALMGNSIFLYEIKPNPKNKDLNSRCDIDK